MEFTSSAKSLTLISTVTVSSASKSSCRFCNFLLPTSPSPDFSARNGIRFRSPSPSVLSGRRCRKWGVHARFPRFLVRASFSGGSILVVVAVAVAAANFAALRLFFLNHVRLKKESPKHSGPEEPELIEHATVLQHRANESEIEIPRDLSVKSSVEEGKRIYQRTDDGVVPEVDYLLQSQMTALKHQGTRAAETTEVHDSQVFIIHPSNNASLQTKESSTIDLPAVILGNGSLLQQKTSAGDAPNLLPGVPQEASIMAEPSLSISAGPTKSVDAKSGESEFQVLSYSGLDAIFEQQVHTVYQEKKADGNSLLPSSIKNIMSPNMSLQNNSGCSLHLTPKRQMKDEAEISHSKGVSQEVVLVASKGSSSNWKEYAKFKGVLRSGRPVNQNSNGVLSRFHQPNGVHIKDKSNPPENYLITYHCLLREERLTDCIELLENMERKGVLDMDKIYHARFLNTCKRKKAVKEAFQFTKLIKKPTLSTFNMLLSVCASSQDSEGPFKVLLLVKRLGLEVDCKLYTTLISACAKTGKVDAMFEVFHEMVNAGVEPNVHTYGALIDGCARAGQVAKAFGAYGILRSKKVKPDRVIFNALITACGQSGAVDRAFDVLAEMGAEPQPIDPDHVTVGALMKTCAQAGQIDRAHEVYKMINQYNIKGTPEVYTIAVNSCSQVGDLEFALCVYNDMKRNGIIPDEMFISALIDVAGHAGEVDTAFEILHGAKIQGIQLGNIAYSSLMGACSNGKNWRKALELYDEIKVLAMTPTVSTINALITALCDGDELKKAVEVLDEMKEAGVCPNAITYSILLVSCERKDEPELALKLFAKAKEDDLPPNLIMCRCLTGLCLSRFVKASSIGEPVLSFHSGTPQIDNKWTSLALKVYRETIAAGVIPSVEVISQVLGCLQLPCDSSLRSRMIENMGIKSDVSRHSKLYSLLDGFGEYDPRSFSLLKEAASLGAVPCVSFKGSPIIVDARKLEIHTAKVYLLTVLKGLSHRLAAGAKLPNITVLLQVEKTQIVSCKGDKTVNLAGRVGQEVAAALRRLGLPYQGKESLGKIRISGLALKRWFQPKLIKLVSPFESKPTESSSFQRTLAEGITNQQRSIRTSNMSLERNEAPYQP